jgi:TPR repeat protein
MGERYRDGDGVPKDLEKAKDYFSRAAKASSDQATNELAQLTSAQ